MTNPLTRLWNRMTGRPAQTRYVYVGAQQSRLTEDWFALWMSGRQELRYEGRVLRLRSRDLWRNNPFVQRYAAALRENVWGPDGIRLEAETQTASGGDNEAADALIEEAWARWGCAGQCSTDRTHTWDSFAAHADETMDRDGECFIRMVPGFDNEFGFALQLIDADMVDDLYSVEPLTGRNGIAQGVEYDGWGAPVAYHVLTRHPMDSGGTQRRDRVPASEMLHRFHPQRPGQMRGVPRTAPVMYALKLLDGYFEAELVAARTSAAKMGWIQQGPDAPGPDVDVPASTRTEADPGVIDRLGVGETFVSWDPQHPSGNFQPFVTQVLLQIAAGLNVSYQTLTGDDSRSNYSSSRMSLTRERDNWRRRQQATIDHFCKPVFARWMLQARLSGQLRLPSADLTRYGSIIWRPRGWDWVDPRNDGEANLLALQMKLTSRSRLCAEAGIEFEDVVKEQAKEDQMMVDAGLNPALPGKIALPAQGAADVGAPVDPNAPPNGNGNGNGTATEGGAKWTEFAPARRW